MPLLDLIILALIQGVTEFLPVSSSGHLILLPALTGNADQGVTLDVAVHVGTLFAVIAYFRADVLVATRGGISLLKGDLRAPGAHLALALVLATIPVIILGLILAITDLNDAMRSITVIGWTMLLFGILLYIADQRGPVERTAPQWTLKHALIMGLWQALALIPGTSRSGITITGARFLGYERKEAARLAMLMSIPTIIASAVVIGLDIPASNAQVWRDAAIAAAFACVAALIALRLMMRFLESVSYTPYVIYRIALGVVLLVIAYT
ncbi:undecaprenyl-diphosphate phosphatase [Pontivivens insulae]|uniref:Undecaprenyl-diphosphatase n=1 Tax=Pontivivens insulae TaxID=1639689 RepID=A0A2R8A801_9RHOB|nr:undecaprenyl-diphosphate phosphatase [Pontivivens insulae]RED18479.1 undecaprenyl-diphosphatase [Pontivivens insulae]SPF28377.1 Undecaprenyl-diphosphatase [Pontivivens insulae]